MNQNMNDSGTPFCGIELIDEDELLRPSHADANCVSTKLNFDPQVRSYGGISPQDLDPCDGILKYINNVMLEESLEEKRCTYGSYADSNSASLNFDPQVQSCLDDSPENLDFGNDVLRYISHALLEDNKEEKAFHVNTGSDKLSFVRTAISCTDDGMENPESSDDVLKYMNHLLLEDDLEKICVNGSCIDLNFAHGNLNFDSQVQPYRVDRPEDIYCGNDSFNVINPFPLEDDDVPEKASSDKTHTDSPEDLDFNDDVLKYINHILMEEDGEEKPCVLEESTALQATENSLYEVIWGQFPASTLHYVPNCGQSYKTPDEIRFSSLSEFHGSGGTEFLHSESGCNNRNLFDDLHGITSLLPQATPQTSYTSSSSNAATSDSTTDSPLSFDLLDISSGSHSVMQLNKEVKDNIIPDSNLGVDLSYNRQISNERGDGTASSVVRLESEASRPEFIDVSRRKKNLHTDSFISLEGRSSKLPSVASESTFGADMYDKVLVFREEKEESAIRKAMSEATKRNLQIDQPKETKGGKRGRKKRAGKRNEVDLRTLLTLCAQAVASEDRRSANEYLRQIREHATPTGDGMQRVAHYFADGLQARLAGAGTQIYTTLMNMVISGSEILKAYHIYLATCPFRKIANFFSNKTILNVAQSVPSIHIVDFGTFHGFQWPSFMQHLASRPGGPPQVRFTGVDLPCPGFRPAQRIEETGRRLAHYAEKFNIPFEFNPIAQKWETIKLEDIKIIKDEVLVVSCLFRLRYLLDETVMSDCPRDMVLNLIRQMNPTVFVVGILNGAYNGPFFLTRFREALFHYSTMFDALDTILPRDMEERVMLERVVLGREAMNAIACEAAERIERPETYRQWQVRLARAGLELLPLDREIIGTVRNRIKSRYHKDFVVDQDGQWLLQGWKGRVLYGLSSWRPTHHVC